MQNSSIYKDEPKDITIKVKNSSPIKSNSDCLVCILRWSMVPVILFGLTPIKFLCPHSKIQYSSVVKFEKSILYIYISIFYILLKLPLIFLELIFSEDEITGINNHGLIQQFNILVLGMYKEKVRN